jgi:glycerate-2-kinase
MSLIKNGLSPNDKMARKIAIKTLEMILEEADPGIVVENSLQVIGNTLVVMGVRFNLNIYDKLFIIGGGKAAVSMAESVEKLLETRITGGSLNIPKGSKMSPRSSKIHFIEASHPIPDQKGTEGALQILKIAENATKKDLVIALISGGASSLLSLPGEGLNLNDIKGLTGALLKSGATIEELNTLRKHISLIKGGRLARACYPATLISLIISDVVGDPLDIVASGPTVPDSSTFKGAISVLKKYGLSTRFPRILNYLEKGVRGEIEETLKEGDHVFNNVYNFLISTNKIVLKQVLGDISKQYDSIIYSTKITGEAREVGEMLGDLVMEKRAEKERDSLERVIVAGGETTVKVKGAGKGGRNQELVLGALEVIEGEGIAIASIGTDGIDGMTDAAGAIADGNSLKRCSGLRLSPRKYLENNDSFNFFKGLNDLIFTGPTGTNINDVMVMVIV